MVNGIEIIYGSVCGLSHQRADLPNQDALSIKFTQGGMAVAVADGHGSGLSFRSDVGSKLAVRAAVETADALAAKGLSGDAFLTQWQKQLVSTWARDVLADLKERPFQQEELKKLSISHSKALASNALFAYGSTIVAAYLLKDFFYIVNLGDSDALVKVDSEIHNVKLIDPLMVGGMTYSLATLGCIKKFASEIIKKSEISSLMLSTDGYQNSFAKEEDFEQVLVDVENLYYNDHYLAIHKQFESWLKDTSDHGSGDDITAIILLKNKFSE